MFGYFFNDTEVKDFDDAKRSDTVLFSKFHAKMLEKGIYLAPSAYEAGFICSTMNESEIEGAIKACAESLEEIVNGI